VCACVYVCVCVCVCVSVSVSVRVVNMSGDMGWLRLVGSLK